MYRYVLVHFKQMRSTLVIKLFMQVVFFTNSMLWHLQRADVGLGLSAYKVVLKTDLYLAYTGLFFTRTSMPHIMAGIDRIYFACIGVFGYAGATSSELYNVVRIIIECHKRKLWGAFMAVTNKLNSEILS